MFAYQFSRRVNDDVPGKLAASVIDPSVDINRYQIDAALFAFNSPLSRNARIFAAAASWGVPGAPPRCYGRDVETARMPSVTPAPVLRWAKSHVNNPTAVKCGLSS